MFFHWLRVYASAGDSATASAHARVDDVFARACAASPAVFAADSRVEALRLAKFEHLCPWAALLMPVEKLEKRAFLEVLVERFDIGLREAGVGDLSVGRKVRVLAGALHGRLQRYGPLLEARKWPEMAQALAEHGVEERVVEALRRVAGQKTAKKGLAVRG